MKIHPAILREALIRSTPALIYDYEAIEANFKNLRKLTTEHEATWSFAVKALARGEIVDIAKNYVDGFDISNIEEWKVIRDHVTDAHKVWLTNASYSELEFFKKHVPKLIVTVNDKNDYKTIKDSGLSYVVRIATTDLIPQNGKSRFGLTLSELHSIEEEILKDQKFKGFHVHQGLEENNFSILHKILSAIQSKFQKFSNKGYCFNIGGGWQLFSDSEIASTLDQLRHQFRVHIEPGRALFKNAGFAMAPIDKFVMDGDTMRIFTRLSFISHLKWSKAVFAGILNQTDKLEHFSPKHLVLEGPSCYEFDKSETVTLDAPIALAKGSLIVLENVSSYSSEWNTSFNGIPECEIKFVGRRRPDNP